MERAKDYGYYCDFIKNDLADYFSTRSYGFNKEDFLKEIRLNFASVNTQENKFNIDWGSGILNCSHQSSAKPGSLIRFEIEERSGYTVDYVTIGSDKVAPTSDNWYSFKMPSYEVNVWAHYVKTKQSSSIITVKKASVIESAPCKIIDLGFSDLLWTDRNIGANSPTDYGDYFAWGETERKTTYFWNNYKYCKDGNYKKLTKYCNQSEFGSFDQKEILEPMDDVAIVKWGNGWRLPTIEEFEELINNCVYKFVENYQGKARNGALFKSKKNGQELFFPAAGCKEEKAPSGVWSYGYYWSSSLNLGSPLYARLLNFYSDHVGTGNRDRYYDFSVRPVRSKN